jgi:hypothetical protein
VENAGVGASRLTGRDQVQKVNRDAGTFFITQQQADGVIGRVLIPIGLDILFVALRGKFGVDSRWKVIPH